MTPDAADRKKPRVLFLCIGNSCRSPLAESIAVRDYSDVFDVSSAGISPLGVVQNLTLETLRNNEYPVKGLASKGIQNEIWAEADLVVNMSGFPKQRVFPRGDWHKIEDWQVEDPYGCAPEVYQKIFEDLRTRIESLAVRLRSKC
jgi:arsenate reductase